MDASLCLSKAKTDWNLRPSDQIRVRSLLSAALCHSSRRSLPDAVPAWPSLGRSWIWLKTPSFYCWEMDASCAAVLMDCINRPNMLFSRNVGGVYVNKFESALSQEKSYAISKQH